MLAEDNLGRLVAEMAEARPGETSLLLLGSGFARAAQVPGVEHVAHEVFGDLFAGDPATASSFLSKEAWEQAQREEESEQARRTLLNAFYKYVTGLSGRLARHSVFWAFYDGFPIQQCYQDVARLIRDGHFHAVLTTNVDTFLEGALDAVGLSEGADYYVVDVVVDPECERCPPSGSDRLVPIVKLHSSLGRSEIPSASSEIASLVRPGPRVLAVGYEFENQPVNNWLAESDGCLWWVDPKRPASEDLALLANWDVQYIAVPEDIDLARFFGRLGTQLASLASRTQTLLPEDSSKYLEAPQLGVKGLDVGAKQRARPVGMKVPKAGVPPSSAAVRVLPPKDALPQTVSVPGKARSVDTGTPDAGGPAGKTVLTEPSSSALAQWAAEVLEGEQRVAEIKTARAELERAEPLEALLAQSREILARLERQRLVRGESDVQLQVQIAYQRDQIGQLEGQLLSIKKGPVVASMRAVETAVRAADIEPEVLSFVQVLLGTVESEYGRPEPNQDVLSAAIGGTVLLGERLGEEVVDPRLVRQLAALIPGGASRRP
jgi:hypothetical protein